MKNIEIINFNKCINVIVEEIKDSNSYSLGFWFNAGSRDETPKNNGISHFIEHMLFKGTPSRTAKQISVQIEKSGAYLNAFTSKENTCFYSRGLPDSLEQSFKVLSDMINNPLFDEKEINKEANVIADELYDILDTPEEFIFDEFEKIIYGKNSLGLPVIGTKENIFNFSHSDLNGYYNSKYLKSKIYIVAVGKVHLKEIIELTEKYFNLDNCSNNKRKKKLRNYSKSFVSIYRPVNQYYSIIGTPATGFTKKDYLKTRLLSIILGEGSSSRLFIKLREQKGIAYQINSFVNSYSDISTLGIYFSTNPAKSKISNELIFNEIEKISRGNIKKPEFERSKKILLSNIVLGIEELSNRMNRIANGIIYSKKVRSVEEVQDELNKIGIDEINEFTKELFNPDNFSQVEILSES